MNNDCDFSQIRIYEGSQHNAFEELVCQIAHLDIPNKAHTFIRKRGAGGDGGVECYWILEDESEYAWQAKFFLESMDTSRWKQISDSVEKALDVHPRLKRYIVCLPLDRTDSRKMGRGGKKVVSILEMWHQNVEVWKKIAHDKNMEVEFIYWGKHEISLYLQREDPRYAGRRLYWFNEPTFRIDDFIQLAKKSEQSLGERYSPNEHVELIGIKQCFDGIGLTPNFWKKARSLQCDLSYSIQRVESAFCVNKKDASCDKEANLLKKMVISTNQLSELLERNIKQKAYFQDINQYRDFFTKISDIAYDIFLKNQPKDKYHSNDKYYAITKFRMDLQKSMDFIDEMSIKIAQDRKVLLTGDAGRGKSHLLCDITLDRLEQNLPTVFILGQHYPGGDPLNFISSSLGVGHQCSNQQVLGALDAAGEAYETNTLIIIDAINEGEHKRDWKNHLSAFTVELLKYPNISIVLSCRSPFCEFLIPDSLSIEEIEHPGFKGNQHQAATKYLTNHGIVLPSVPFLAEEFTNPLFLKTCCKVMRSRNQHAFPEGLQGIKQIFNFFLECIEENIRIRKQYRRSEFKIRDVINAFIRESFPDQLHGIPIIDARRITNDFDPNPNVGESLFNELISEGILAEDRWLSGDDDIDVVRFSFERFTDILTGEWLASQLFSGNDTIQRLSNDHPLSYIFLSREKYRFRGVQEGLYLSVAETYRKELGDIIPEGEQYIDDNDLIDLFQDTILFRSGDSITPRSRELLNRIPESAISFFKERLDILLSFSHEPTHPWNADFLHSCLSTWNMGKRDAFWSIHVAISYFEENRDQPESTISTLLKWALYGNLIHVENKRIRLCAIVFIWFLTAPNQKIRDMATKATTKILALYPDCLPELIVKFHSIDDLYLKDRFYAIIFGVISNIQDDELVKKIALLVYEQVFENGHPIPHLLLRDYACSVMEYAFIKNLLPENIIPNSFRPPYQSHWIPLSELPGKESGHQYDCSLITYDFEKHVRETFKRFTSTPLSQKNIWSIVEVKEQFKAVLSNDVAKKYVDYLKRSNNIDKKLQKLRKKLYGFHNNEKTRKDDDFNKLSSEESHNKMEEEQLGNIFEDIALSLPEEHRNFFEMSHDSLQNCSDETYNALIDKQWVIRWIVQRACSMVESNKTIIDYNERVSHYERAMPGVEALEEKYQRLAFRELLARAVDNFHILDSFSTKKRRYKGPWQFYEREIDPSCFLTSTLSQKNRKAWWQEHSFHLEKNITLEEQISWLQTPDMPPFEDLLSRKDAQGVEWLLLHTCVSEEKKPPEEFTHYPRQDVWYRINSLIIRKEDYHNLTMRIKNHGLQNPGICSSNDTDLTFLGEYPWHCTQKTTGRGMLKDIKRIVPTANYFWEGHLDSTIDDLSICFYLPSKWLIEKLGIQRHGTGEWYNIENKLVFFDPCLKEAGPSCALVNKSSLLSMLEKRGLQLVWLIGGEKNLYPYDFHSSTYHGPRGRYILNGQYTLSPEGIISGNFWFIKESFQAHS